MFWITYRCVVVTLDAIYVLDSPKLSGDEEIPFFSSYFNAPDRGISRALTILGYSFNHSYSTNIDISSTETRLSELRWALQQGPVVVGPMEMSRLTYNPNYKSLEDADHFVTVIQDLGDHLRIHDPKGFPFAVLDIANFLDAWRAERIDYRIGSYSMWTDLNRASTPSQAEVIELVNQEISSIIRREKELNDEKVGVGAINILSERALQKSLAPHVIEHLTEFALPLGARRANDYAQFYKPFDEKKSTMKYRIATLFGTALSSIMLPSEQSFADILLEIADVETEFQESVLRG